jgi:citronellyl-CoA dehydrogenase
MKGKIKSADQLYFTKDHEMVRKSAREFVKKEINANLDQWEEQGSAPLRELFKKMGDLGFLGIRYDTKYGGQGLGLPIAICVQTHMATPAIDQFGSEYLKETYLKPAIAGDKVAAIAVTESNAGSDVSFLSTTAKKDGDSYVINGSKTFITNGTQADFLTLLARTSDEPGFHSFSLFVVPTDSPGFKVSKKLDKLGMRSSDTAELFFDNVRVPAENLIGEEGEGFIYQMGQFQHERFSGLPLGYITTQDMIDITVEYTKGRVVFGKPLIKKQVLQYRLVEWQMEIECLKQLVYHIVRMKSAGLDVTREVTMGKLKAARLFQEVAEGCIQMFGGMGFMNEMLITRYYRDARVLSVGGGADEVMCYILSKISGF